MQEEIRKKLTEAKETIKKCVGKKGFYAGDYYKQYWTRDFVYSLDAILELDFIDLAKSHYTEIFKKQKSTGEVPAFIRNKEDLIPTLIGYFSGILTTINYRGLHVFHPSQLTFFKEHHEWTADSNILAIIGLKKYELYTKDKSLFKENEEKISKILNFVESKVEVEFKFIRGSGWADAMKNYKDKFCLVTQVLLYEMYKFLKEENKAESLKKNINEFFWNEELGYYTDYLGSNRFDALGNSLAIIHEIVPKERIDNLLESFNIASTRFGYRNLSPPYRMSECSQKPNTYQNSSIWPFICANVIISFVKVGLIENAKEEFLKMNKLKGFNEWYCPITGKPKGSNNQLWSAAGYIKAYGVLSEYL
jgi:glycogen debranching enzyme